MSASSSTTNTLILFEPTDAPFSRPACMEPVWQRISIFAMVRVRTKSPTSVRQASFLLSVPDVHCPERSFQCLAAVVGLDGFPAGLEGGLRCVEIAGGAGRKHASEVHLDVPKPSGRRLLAGLVIVRERGGNSVPAVFGSESQAAAFIRARGREGAGKFRDDGRVGAA